MIKIVYDFEIYAGDVCKSFGEKFINDNLAIIIKDFFDYGTDIEYIAKDYGSHSGVDIDVDKLRNMIIRLKNIIEDKNNTYELRGEYFDCAVALCIVLKYLHYTFLLPEPQRSQMANEIRRNQYIEMGKAAFDETDESFESNSSCVSSYENSNTYIGMCIGKDEMNELYPGFYDNIPTYGCTI